VSPKESISLDLLFEKISNLNTQKNTKLSAYKQDPLMLNMLRILQLFRMSESHKTSSEQVIKNMIISYPRGFPIKRIFEIVSSYYDFKILDVSTSSLKKNQTDFSLKSSLLFCIHQLIPSILESDIDSLSLKGVFLVLRQPHFGNISILSDLDTLAAIGLKNYLSHELVKSLDKIGYSGLSGEKLERIQNFVAEKIKLVCYVWGSAYEFIRSDIERNLPSLSSKFQLINIALPDKSNSSFYEQYKETIIRKSLKVYSSSQSLFDNAYMLQLEEAVDLKNKGEDMELRNVEMTFKFLMDSERITVKKMKQYIKNFLYLRKYKMNRIKEDFNKYNQGFKKIEETNAQIQELQKHLNQNKLILQEKEGILKQKVQEIKRAESQVQSENKKALKLKQYLQKEEGLVSDKREIVQSKLSKVLPMIEQAKKNVRAINKSYLSNNP
jgi:hypothetical protein